MIRMVEKKIILILSILFTVIAVHAAAPKWQIIPNESSITFIGTQNNAPATGSFKKFDGEIEFDPEQLNVSKARLVIDMASLITSYAELKTTLISPDWFNTKLFPQAIFISNRFEKLSSNQFQVEGMLTIRNKSMPVTLKFISEDLGADKKKVTGNMNLKRNLFGIGQGEWADTDIVKDDVQVNFVITAVKK